jgi:competence protein ComEA
MSDLSSRPSADTSPYTFRHRFTAAAAESARLTLLRLDRAAVFGIAVIGVLAVVVTVVLVQGGKPSSVSYSGDGSPLASASPSEAAAAIPTTEPSESGTVVVDVAGRVHRPGLVTVPTGSRVWDVVEAAGGFRRPKDSVSLNLARVVADGEQVVVGVAAPGGVATPLSGDASSTGSAPGEPVDLNTADLAALDTLPGVGPVLAQRILEYRTTNGPFRSVDELNDVSGIGEVTFADLAPLVRV